MLIIEKEREELREHIEYYQSYVVELQNKIQEYENYFATQDELAKKGEDEEETKTAPPRVFCDICDAFDVHDTEDCPLQSMVDKDLEAHSMHNIAQQKSTTRLYCDNCEEFGHDTNDDICPNKNKNDDDDQMF